MCVCTIKWTLGFFTGRLSERAVCQPAGGAARSRTVHPGGKAKLSGVRGHRHRSGHTRVRTVFTTGEAHLRPPTTALPPQYCTSAGGAVLQDPLGGSKAPYSNMSYHDILT